MSEAIDRIAALLRAGIVEIEEEEAKLRKVGTSLGEGPPTNSPKALRTSKRRDATKRAKKGQRREEVKALLEADPKARTSEIARQIGISSNQVSGLKGQLVKEQKSARGKQRAKKVAPKAPRTPKKSPVKASAKKDIKKSSKAKALKATKASPAKALKK